MVTAILAACWLLGFAVMALAIGPDRPERAAQALPLEAEALADSEKLQQAGGIDAVRSAAAALKPAALAGMEPAAAAIRAAEWAKAVGSGGGSPIDALGEILPPPVWFQARLVTRRDEPDIELDATIPGEYGEAYTALRDALPGTQASSDSVETVLDEIWRASDLATRLRSGPAIMLKRSDRWLPAKATLASAHQYALDIFFTSVRKHGAAERGPVIKSMASGIVVAAAGDWSGGDKPSLYQGGGLSPKAGNGVIIYNPDSKRYYAYFHLSDVDVRAGQVVEAGEKIARGGNTGVNARKKGHGGHVHVEIHDVDGGAWTSYRIRDFIVSLH